MAKFGFVTIEPSEGSGVQAVQVSADAHTGRLQRTKAVQVTATSVSAPEQLEVIQAGAAENVKVTSATATVTKEGGSVTITGTSNSTKLTFSLNQDGDNPLVLTIPESYLANSVSTANDAEITGDPGATAKYNFSITFTGIPANETINELKTTLTVKAAGSQTATVAITQAAGDPYIDLDKNTINLDANGTAQTVNVDSNTSWTWSEVVSGFVLQAMRAARLKK